MNTEHILNQFSSKKIAVIGDVMLDRYIIGSVDRISPEAPIPIISKQETLLVPGGAGNTAANVTGLGASCNLTGILGDDLAGVDLLATLKEFSIETVGLLKDNRPTTEKTRIIGNHQQIARIDHESTALVSGELETKLCQRIIKIISGCQAVIVCDYAKGVITPKILDSIREAAQTRSLPVLVDVRPEHREWYHDVSFLTPNKKELSGLVGKPIRTLEDVGTYGLQLAQELRTNLLVTLSHEGMMLIDHTTGKILHLESKAQEVIDVSGAGDTVIATLALALAAGASTPEAADIANHAAAIVVSKLGTATLTIDELKRALK